MRWFLLFLAAFLVQYASGCHNVQKHTDEKYCKDDKHKDKAEYKEKCNRRRRRRSVDSSSLVADTLSLRTYFNDCLFDKLDSSESFTAEVDYIILDSMWYLNTDAANCKGSNDEAGCWKVLLESFLKAGELYDAAAECIDSYSEDSKVDPDPTYNGSSNEPDDQVDYLAVTAGDIYVSSPTRFQTRDEALSYCRDNGGEGITYKTQDEYNHVMDILKNNFTSQLNDRGFWTAMVLNIPESNIKEIVTPSGEAGWASWSGISEQPDSNLEYAVFHTKIGHVDSGNLIRSLELDAFNKKGYYAVCIRDGTANSPEYYNDGYTPDDETTSYGEYLGSLWSETGSDDRTNEYDFVRLTSFIREQTKFGCQVCSTSGQCDSESQKYQAIWYDAFTAVTNPAVTLRNLLLEAGDAMAAGWTDWESQGCSTTCGEGTETFTRTCLGSECDGESTKSEPCTDLPQCDRGCRGLGGKKVYLDKHGPPRQRMTRCTNCQGLVKNTVHDAIILTAVTDGDAKKMWTLIPHEGKCMLRADNNMFATRCGGCFYRNVYNAWGLLLHTATPNAWNQWVMEKVGEKTYTFKLPSHNQYISKCTDCARVGTNQVFAQGNGGQLAWQRWDITVIDEDQQGGDTCQSPYHYTTSLNKMTWDEAKTYCEGIGGNLATTGLNDVTSFEIVAGMVRRIGNKRQFGQDYWIGYTDKVTEGKWKWIDGSEHGGVRWGSKQPDNWKNNEDCAGLMGDKNWKLNDFPCSHSIQALCQHKRYCPAKG